jgi:DNA-binding transcriptional ArsR family regulator
MPTEPETLALERPQEQDKFLALIEKVIVNKDVDAEKLKVLVELQIQLEDRQSEQRFNAAMIAARNDVQGIGWDRVNPHTKSNYASYPAIDRKLRPIMETHGFAVTFGAQPSEQPNMMIMYADVMHEAGHTKRYPLPMPIDNKGPQGNSGVMTGPQAVGNGTSYGMRYLVKMIFNIPMLVDKDDNDGNQVKPPISESQAKILRDLFDRLSEPTRAKVLEYLSNTYKQDIKSVEDIPSARYKHAETTLARALNSEGKAKPDQEASINDIQITTLQEVIEGIGKTCKSDFLAHFKIKRIGDLPAGKYPDSLKWLEQQRRK